MQGILDLTSTEGRKYFERATRQFMGEEPYNAKPEGLYGFAKNLENHARKYGWVREYTGIFWIPHDIENPEEEPYINLITNYGEVTLETLTEWERTYLSSETREAQDSVQAYYAIRQSLSEEGLKKVNIYENEYIIDGIPSGPLFWKVLLRESHLDTNATALSIRASLGTSALESYIVKVSYDITKFNQYVLTLLEALQARGETTHDLLSNLLTTYTTVKDEAFRTYILNRKSDYEDGTRDFTHAQLMVLAENKYKNLVLNGTWSHESYEDKLIALQAEQEKTNKALERIKCKKGSEDKQAGKGRESKKGRTEDLPDWMFKEPPADKLKEPREYNGKPWYYCSKKTGGRCEPGQYRRHKPSDCKGQAKKTKGHASNKDKPNKKKTKEEKKRIKVAQALLGIEDKASGSESDSE